MTPPIRYSSWSQVPPSTYLTKSELAQLDQPREPGPLAATVEGYDYRDKRTTIMLYRIDESTPTRSTGATITAARHRAGKLAVRTCTECGAHPDLSLTEYQGGDALCRACCYIERLRRLQKDVVRLRKHAAGRAREVLATPAVVLHVDVVSRGATTSGKVRAPGAIRLTALDMAGKKVLGTTVRLLGPRAGGVPADAVRAGDAALTIREALAGRKVVRWMPDGLNYLRTVLSAEGWSDVVPEGRDTYVDLSVLASHWRSAVDPYTAHLRPVIHPGRADRMLHLLQQMALTAPKEDDAEAGRG